MHSLTAICLVFPCTFTSKSNKQDVISREACKYCLQFPVIQLRTGNYQRLSNSNYRYLLIPSAIGKHLMYNSYLPSPHRDHQIYKQVYDLIDTIWSPSKRCPHHPFAVQFMIRKKYPSNNWAPFVRTRPLGNASTFFQHRHVSISGLEQRVSSGRR